MKESIDDDYNQGLGANYAESYEKSEWRAS